MPTVTVLAWCLIASTGRVSSSIAAVQRAGEVLDHRARRADLAVLDLERVERQHAASRTGTATRAAPRSGLERAVVDAAAELVEEPGRRALELFAEPFETGAGSAHAAP